ISRRGRRSRRPSASWANSSRPRVRPWSTGRSEAQQGEAQRDTGGPVTEAPINGVLGATGVSCRSESLPDGEDLMPSPFPGMDPYLENHSLWKSVHDSLVYRMLEDLQPQLQPRYLAVLEGRLLLQPLDQFSPVTGFRTGWSDV